MPETEIEALAIDIEKHGQREKGVTLDGMILDGWHRYLACCRAGVQFKSEEFDGDDPVGFVISTNLHRRHLTASQRAACVVAASAWKPIGSNQYGGSVLGTEASTKQLAEKAEVSESTIEHAKAAERAGRGEDVRAGRISAKRAAGFVQKKRRQPEPDPESEKHAPDLADELERADKQIREQQELIESLKKDDLAKEVSKWKQKYDQLNGRVQQLATTTAEAQKTAQYQADLLAKIRKALKVQKNTEILPALK